MSLSKHIAWISLFLCLTPALLAKRRAPLVISPEECLQHKLPAIEFMMPWSTGVAELKKFPDPGVYVGNVPTPPGGAYAFTILAYQNQPTGRQGLIDFLKSRYPEAKFADAPDWESFYHQKYPACTFEEGGGHAHTAYAAVQIVASSQANCGAVMIHGYGPWPNKPPDFTEISKFFSKVQIRTL